MGKLNKGECEKMLWHLKQILPMTYTTRCEMNGKKYFVVWKMWFCRCFKEKWIEIA